MPVDARFLDNEKTFVALGKLDLLNRVRARSSKNVYLKVFST